jgi:hypothetical protein
MALTQVDQGLLNSYAQYTGFKNRIINGAMVIDQRNAGALSTVNSTLTYFLDRWAAICGSSGSIAIGLGRITTAPAGFINSIYMYTNIAGVQAAGSKCAISQPIEGFNVSDLGWGAAGASTVTLSFWVRSTTIGTHAVSLANATTSATRSYIATFTISVANTWEYKTITIPGDTSGTWAKDNTAGIVVRFDYGSGTNYESTASSWLSTDSYRTSGCVNLSNTSGGNILVSGVQLEKGSTATSFDYRPYGTELALCQRYYWLLATGDNASISNACAWSASEVDTIIQYPVQMRSAPSLSATSGSTYYNFRSGSGGATFTSFSLIDTSSLVTRMYSSTVSTVEGRGGYLKTNNPSCFVAFQAEL